MDTFDITGTLQGFGTNLIHYKWTEICRLIYQTFFSNMKWLNIQPFCQFGYMVAYLIMN